MKGNSVKTFTIASMSFQLKYRRWRDREEDVILLAQSFASAYAVQDGPQTKTAKQRIDSQAQVLQLPGNVREAAKCNRTSS